MMTITDELATLRYLVNDNGEKTDVLIPLTTWHMLVALWKQLVDILEEEDLPNLEERDVPQNWTFLKEWLEQHVDSEIDISSLTILKDADRGGKLPVSDTPALRPFGLCKGAFTVPDGFDDPLPEDIIKAFEGK